jgi:hypothetical protein
VPVRAQPGGKLCVFSASFFLESEEAYCGRLFLAYLHHAVWFARKMLPARSRPLGGAPDEFGDSLRSLPTILLYSSSPDVQVEVFPATMLFTDVFCCGGVGADGSEKTRQWTRQLLHGATTDFEWPIKHSEEL